MPSIVTDYRIYDSETSRLINLCVSLSGLQPGHQKLVAEIVLLRLFSLFENFVSSVAKKLACGASYADGSAPVLLLRASSSPNAEQLFKTHGRARPRRDLKWTKASEIKENTRQIIDPSDNFVKVIDRNGSFIDELRRVRNRIAHNNARSRNHYREIVRRYYGALLNPITPGILLITQKFAPPLIEVYIRQSKILAKDVVKMP